MNYPDYNTYTKLYGRYLKKSVDRFFRDDDPKGKIVLDLCAGGGQLSQYALEHGAARVVMVDTAPQMLNPTFKKDDRVYQVRQDVSDYIRNFRMGPYKEDPQFDIVVCRQAVNYWFLNVSGEDIANVVKKDGWLVFNTFGNRPSDTPTIREYYHEGIAYKEISYRVDEMIHHVQTATGFPPHITKFPWIDRGDFSMKLNPHFNCCEMIDGPSSMWYCRKL
jgi:SAM-dependent methyltransferase